MPMKIVPGNVLRKLPALKYATQAAPKQDAAATSLPKREPRYTTLPNGIKVASLENYSPVSRVSIAFKAGSRYETSENLGITHSLRNYAGLTTQDATIFGITRNIQQLGASLTATTTRELFSYDLECVRDNVETALGFLNQVITKQVFKPWELKDHSGRIKLDLAILNNNPYLIMLENLHKVAYRTSLKNSLYTPKHMIGEHESEMLQHFVKKHFLASNVVVAGVGICHDYLVEFASKHFGVENGTVAKQEQSKYGGGDIRLDIGGPLSYVAVVSEGAGFNEPKDFLALGLLQQELGLGPNVKYANGTAYSKTASTIAAATDKPFAYSALNLNYTDTGLFGFYCVAHHEEMAKVLKAAFLKYSHLAKSGISDTNLVNAKQRLKAQIALARESSTNLCHEFVSEALIYGQLPDPELIFKKIDEMRVADVNEAFQKVLAGRISLSAVGNLAHTPYIDELK